VKHPASIVRGKWIFGVVIALGALGAASGWAQSESALPSGVSVRLEPKGARPDYLMGEPINLTLSFSADHPGYVADTERIFGVGSSEFQNKLQSGFDCPSAPTDFHRTLAVAYSGGAQARLNVTGCAKDTLPGKLSSVLSHY
jgi:hypothetical protein